MISSKVTLPSETFINFYYWFSTATLILTWMIAPLLFYVIFTQSKNLKSLKWLFLNHLFWCLAWETFFATMKPFILTPAASGYPLGLLRNGNFKTTAIATLIGVLLASISIASLGATLLSRYLLVFPSKVTKCLNIKIFIWFTFILAVVVIILGSIVIFQMLNIDEKEMRQAALDYDPFLLKFFNESSFIFIPYSLVEIPLLIIWIIIIFLFTLAFFGILYFIYSLWSYSSSTANINVMQRSLIISAIVQVLLTSIFLIFPFFVIITSAYFQIPNSAENFFIIYCFLVTHTFIEFIATLYFVKNYRAFISKIFDKILCRLSRNSSHAVSYIQ